MSFKNKVVLVTGASSGIGAATAIKFVEEGASIVIVGLEADKLRSVSDKCESAGFKPLTIAADITNDENLEMIIDKTLSQFGKLDILINNAGILHLVGILSKDAMKYFDKIIATNLRSVVYLTHLAVPHLIKTKGNVVNVSSIAGKGIALVDAFAYETSKAGMDHFTRSVALELAPKGVRVNSINPGLVRTDVLQSVGVDKSVQENFWDSLIKTAPLGKVAVSEEIADLILFIASNKAGSITGSSFVADNGAMLSPYIGNVGAK